MSGNNSTDGGDNSTDGGDNSTDGGSPTPTTQHDKPTEKFQEINGVLFPSDWQVVEKSKVGPFIVGVDFKQPNGRVFRWSNRRHRKGRAWVHNGEHELHAGKKKTPEEVVATRKPLWPLSVRVPVDAKFRYFGWEPRNIVWCYGWAFTLGSILFVIGGVPSLMSTVINDTDETMRLVNIPFVIGASFFLVGAYVAHFNVLNLDEVAKAETWEDYRLSHGIDIDLEADGVPMHVDGRSAPSKAMELPSDTKDSDRPRPRHKYNITAHAAKHHFFTNPPQSATRRFVGFKPTDLGYWGTWCLTVGASLFLINSSTVFCPLVTPGSLLEKMVDFLFSTVASVLFVIGSYLKFAEVGESWNPFAIRRDQLYFYDVWGNLIGSIAFLVASILGFIYPGIPRDIGTNTWYFIGSVAFLFASPFKIIESLNSMA
ncbi:hypothetical protein INT43_000637 [Umbelopsis isabellina]|uniref:YrhK domain-containing protein n=1 Tax=Mortierella isabellina TaxID=91625 RepID=A0A8H7Q1K0_MORIS|nr:hypothetical protein INT43_000637 [Umbelopsis isabellina]